MTRNERDADERTDPTRRRLLAGSAALAASAIGVPSAARSSVSGATQSDAPRRRGQGAAGRWPTTGDDVRRRGVVSSGVQETVPLDGVESLVDGHMRSAVEEGDVVGAAATVVRGDETVFAEGYGETRLDGGEPVDTDTRFRVGSVSKPFVWTAAMQLIEEGAIDPDEDVRTYLDSVPIPETYDEPITMAHLATHTAGFEERLQGTWVDDPDDLRSLETVLADEQPARVRPPGRQFSYSNYGAALAGQVVADVSSQPFGASVADRIFEPLGMSTATFEQPRPDDGAVGYTVALGQTVPTDDPRSSPTLLEIAPAGSMSASVSDVGRYAQAMLGEGAVGGGRILPESAIDRMHDRWFSHHPALDGVGFGWMERSRGDHRIVWHNGAIPGSFYSHLLLVPDADVGLVLVYNTDSGATAASDLVDDFLAEYFPVESPQERSPDGPPSRGGELAGTYRGLRVAETSHGRLPTTLNAGSVSVEVRDDGTVRTTAGESTTEWVEREPLLFDEVDGTRTMAFEADQSGVSHLYLGRQAFRRRSWHESAAFQGPLAAGATLGTIAGGIGWPAVSTWQWITDDEEAPGDDQTTGSAGASTPSEDEASPDELDERRSESPTPETDDDWSDRLRTLASDRLRTPTAARRLLLGAIGSLFVFGIGSVAAFFGNQLTFFSQPPLPYRVLLVLPVVATLATLGSVGSAVLAWRDGAWSRGSGAFYGVVAVSTAVACWLLYYWRLFGTPG